ncbi:MAG TPA: haloacid dehalogenase-like hydrolase [Firmicutes bacterium]|nr:haloacid dehalogenase-like hydrolase [Bacillota bacterium]
MRPKHNTIALIYDFDGTLSPKSMHEYTFFPEAGIGSEDFWVNVEKQNRRYEADSVLTYMRLMIEKAEEKKYALTRSRFNLMAKKMKYFKGVETYFSRVNHYVRKKFPGVEVRHYIISAGIKEILEAVSVRKHFYNIFASEFFYGKDGRAVFPNIAINDTAKTQYIFRINKGREKQHESINEHMPQDKRKIPFENMLYIGDGLTDVPCMTLVRGNGGHSIAVHSSKEGRDTCRLLLDAGRVDFIAKADYSSGSELDKLIRISLDAICSGIKLKTA